VFCATAFGAATRAEYVAQAEPFCASANADIAKLDRKFSRLDAHGKFAAAGKVEVRTGARLAESVGQVRAISPPPGDERQVSQWLGLVDQVARYNRQQGIAHGRQRFRLEERLLGKRIRVSRRAHKLVAGYGFSACVGKSGGPLL
jgi:hypothetical protein